MFEDAAGHYGGKRPADPALQLPPGLLDPLSGRPNVQVVRECRAQRGRQVDRDHLAISGAICEDSSVRPSASSAGSSDSREAGASGMRFVLHPSPAVISTAKQSPTIERTIASVHTSRRGLRLRNVHSTRAYIPAAVVRRNSPVDLRPHGASVLRIESAVRVTGA